MKAIFTTLTVGLLVVSAVLAASPPGYVNYQGVLRDASNAPIDGLEDMVFRFYDTDGEPGCVGGTLLFVDAWGREKNRGYFGRRELRSAVERDFERQMMFEATLREPIERGYDDGIYGFMYKKISE